MNFTSVFRTSLKVDWTGISQPIQDSLKYFVVYEDDKYVYEFDRKDHSPKHRKMIWVLKNATQKELFHLTDHPHGMVKVLSYLKLMNSEFSGKYQLLKKAFQETNVFVEEKNGCRTEHYLLSEFLNEHGLFLEVGLPSPPLPVGFHDKLGLKEEEIVHITNMLENQIMNKDLYINLFYSDISDEKVFSYCDK